MGIRQCVFKSDFVYVHHGAYPFSTVTQNDIEITDTKTWCYISIFSEVCLFGWFKTSTLRNAGGIMPLSVTVRYEEGGGSKS